MLTGLTWADDLKLAANISTVYAQLPNNQRPRAAAHDGYRFIETWWPFHEVAPDDRELHSFCTAVEQAGVQLVSINLDAGDYSRGDRGILSHPHTGDDIRRNVDSVLTILHKTGCRVVNALFGNWVEGFDWSAQFQTGLERLVSVADAVATRGARVVVETLNSTDSPRFPLIDIADTVDLVEQANRASAADNVGLLLDTYQLAMGGADPVAVLRRYPELVCHVQFADVPGRGMPGTGRLDFAAIAAALAEIEYTGYVSLEYFAQSPSIANQPGRLQ